MAHVVLVKRINGDLSAEFGLSMQKGDKGVIGCSIFTLETDVGH